MTDDLLPYEAAVRQAAVVVDQLRALYGKTVLTVHDADLAAAAEAIARRDATWAALSAAVTTLTEAKGALRRRCPACLTTAERTAELYCPRHRWAVRVV